MLRLFDILETNHFRANILLIWTFFYFKIDIFLRIFATIKRAAKRELRD